MELTDCTAFLAKPTLTSFGILGRKAFVCTGVSSLIFIEFFCDKQKASLGIEPPVRLMWIGSEIVTVWVVVEVVCTTTGKVSLSLAVMEMVMLLILAP